MPATAVWRLRGDMRFRVVLPLTLLGGVLALAFVGLAFFASFAWPDDSLATPSTHSYPGSIDQYQVGVPVQIPEGKYWLVRLSEHEVIALYQQDPFRGCTVPWRPNFSFTDPKTGESRQGWFRNPCSGSTYALDGHCVFGPCIRGLDRRPVDVSAGGRIVVDTAPRQLINGQPNSPMAPDYANH